MTAARLLVLCLVAPALTAQQFVSNTTAIPQGNPFNNSPTENVDFGDIDLDGDWDAVFADGGEDDLDQNRIWLNQGPSFTGHFLDVTATNAPTINDQSQDIEFADIDGDGDLDVYVANSSQIAAQTDRWWVNVGLATGIFVDETSKRWVNLGVNDGLTTFSSVSPANVLAAGGFIDWAGDGAFGDLDNDGDLDLFHSSFGVSFSGLVPSRIFLNDGAGYFEEFNPSHFQLAGTNIANGDPALWAEGTHQHDTTNPWHDLSGIGSEAFQTADVAQTALDVDLMDVDGDLDLDVLHGARQEIPRIFENRIDEGGAFRDRVQWLAQTATGGSNYEQELGDVDGDGDVDLYGLNWSGFEDTLQFNDGAGHFGAFQVLPGSASDDNEVDFFDYDNDGDLDAYVANFSGADRLYDNDGAGALTLTSGVLGAGTNGISLDADMADVDGDGDYDVLIAFDINKANVYLQNTTTVGDTTAPTLARLEQAPNRAPSAMPTVVRVQVYDNVPYYIAWYDEVTLEYSVDGGAFTAVPMKSSGGQIFRGEVPGNLQGTVCYRAYAVDEHGNTSAPTPELCYASTFGPLVYCTATPSSAGCLNAIDTSEQDEHPTSGAADYSITCLGVQGFKNGILFAGVSGPLSMPFASGILCVNPPLKRGPIQSSGGVSPLDCSGAFSQIVNDGAIVPLGLDAGAGNSAWYQWWYRDPANGPGNLGSALSDGVRLDFQ